MSNFDPKSPSYVPPGNVVNTGANFVVAEGNQQAEMLLPSGSLITTGTSIAVTNPNCRGALFLPQIESYPASASVTLALKIQVSNAASSGYLTIASHAPRSAAGSMVFMCYPGTSASADGIAIALPYSFNVRLSVSSGATNGTLTMAMSMLRIA